MSLSQRDLREAQVNDSQVETIHLPRGVWFLDPNQPLGLPGGFGAVFAGRDENGAPVAIKRLHLGTHEVGHRELRVAEELIGSQHLHVIPVLDAGVDPATSRYFVVMARADRSLQSFIDEGLVFSEGDAVMVLDHIAAGLQEIADLVHRDLKPGNVLLHEGLWKVADLGIARFIEESTSLNTLRDCLSPGYAAPEQWRMERANKATDVYALGCIAYALLTGRPPFSGPSRDEFCRQHLEERPPALVATPRLRQLAAMCLSKAAPARPSLAVLRKQLGMPTESPKPTSVLAAAGARLAEQRVTEEAASARRARENKERKDVARAGLEVLGPMIRELFAEIRAEAPPAEERGRGPLDNEIRLGTGRLWFSVPFPTIPSDVFRECGWNVVAGAIIGVTQDNDHFPGRSANLWYGDLDNQGTFRWWEVPYMTNAFIPNRRQMEPFGFVNENDLHDAVQAAAPIMATNQLAARPVPIDLEHQEEFFERWKRRLAQASTNSMPYPSQLPE